MVFLVNATGINTRRAASLHDFFNQELGGQSTVLSASCGIPKSQEERSDPSDEVSCFPWG